MAQVVKNIILDEALAGMHAHANACTSLIFITKVLWPYKGKIWYFIKFNSPIYIGIIVGIIFNKLGLKGHPLAPVVFGVFIALIYFLMFKRIGLAFKHKSTYKDKSIAFIYIATVPVAFISMSILMLHTYYVTQTYYFLLMLLSTMVTYLIIVVLAFVTLRKENKRYFKKNWTIYLFFIPAAVFAIIFAYVPMLGILLAFKDYNIHLGSGPINAFFLSEWVGFEHFQKLFQTGDFILALKNTLLISTYKIVFVSPLPIFLAILTAGTNRIPLFRLIVPQRYIDRCIQIFFKKFCGLDRIIHPTGIAAFNKHDRPPVDKLLERSLPV